MLGIWRVHPRLKEEWTAVRAAFKQATEECSAADALISAEQKSGYVDRNMERAGMKGVTVRGTTERTAERKIAEAKKKLSSAIRSIFLN